MARAAWDAETVKAKKPSLKFPITSTKTKRNQTKINSKINKQGRDANEKRRHGSAAGQPQSAHRETLASGQWAGVRPGKNQSGPCRFQLGSGQRHADRPPPPPTGRLLLGPAASFDGRPGSTSRLLRPAASSRRPFPPNGQSLSFRIRRGFIKIPPILGHETPP